MVQSGQFRPEPRLYLDGVRAIASQIAEGAPPTYQHEASPYAGYGARLLAFLIDQLFLLSLLFLLIAVAALEVLLTSDYGEVDPPTRSYYVGIGIVGAFLPLWLLYHVLCWGFWGKTIGKMVMGIQIVRRDGDRIGLGRAILRTFAYLISTLTLHLPTLFALFGDERRAMHDILAGTVVATDAAVRAHREGGLA